MNAESINAAIREVTGLELDFYGDLNAMHEAENVLRLAPGTYQPGGMGHYLKQLCEVVGTDPDDSVRATARELAEASLQTIGKWEEPK